MNQIKEGLIKVSVIIPVFNEEGALSATFSSVSKILTENSVEHEIIAVNDGSNDNSGSILNNLKIDKLNVIHHRTNRGYGASLKTGIRSSKYPWILITDADGTYPINRIPDLIKHAKDNDMVVGSRSGGKVHDTFFRKIGRGIVRKFASYVTGADIKDINSGLRIFKKEDAEKFWHLFPEGFSFTTTITVASHTKGNKIEYLPIDYYKRAGQSSIKPAKDFVGFLSLIARLAIYYRPLKVFVPVALLLFFASWFVLLYSYFIMHQIMDATFAVLVISSVQIMIFGFIADMIVKRFYND